MEETITLAGGCFWCTEAVFKRVKGVTTVVSGFANSKIPNPRFEQVYAGMTDSAEAIQIKFDTSIVSLDKILEIFFATHDPTSLNKQECDIGTQYRSAIFFEAEEQRNAALKIKSKIPNAVTEITKFVNFYPADDMHKDFYDKNRNYPYCRLIIDPKITKLLKEFKNEVR